MEESILDFIGSELIAVITPVSICMFLVVLLVSTLSSPSPSSSSQLATVVNIVFAENPTDSTSAKLTGAVETAVVFILFMAAATFLIVILYYYNFTNFLKYYMRFSIFFILLTLGGLIIVSILRHFEIDVDVVSFAVFMFNFAGVGVAAVFGGGGVPIVVTQGYTVAVGIIAAAWFTQLPEWTTWVLLVALAVYDLVAVLAPGGPLKILLELAETRDDDLPALVYEARPRVRVSRGGGRIGGLGDDVGIEMQSLGGNDGNVGGREEERVGLVSNLGSSSEIGVVEEDDDSEMIIRGSVLGVGDFVFYSVLVGRAAMYDLMTVYACYLAIISGLACTITLSFMGRRSLPALPISIALGIAFYFLTRLLMEPFVVQTSTSLLMF